MGTDPNDLGLKKSYTKKIGKQNVDDYAKQGYNHLLDQFFSKQEEFDDKLKMANEEIIEIKENEESLDLRELSSGLYLMKITMEDEQQVMRFVIE